MLYGIFRFMCISSHPWILITSGLCVLACAFASSHPQTFGSFVLVDICTSLYLHILRLMCACWHPCILISWGSCVLTCVLTSYTHILSFLCIWLYPNILTSLCHITRFLCVFFCILASPNPHPQVHECLLVSFHPHILSFMCVSFLSSHSLILICSDSCVLVCILASSYTQALRLIWSFMLIDIVASSYHHGLVS